MPHARPATVVAWRPLSVPEMQVVRVENDTRLWTGHSTSYGLTVTYGGAFDF